MASDSIVTAETIRDIIYVVRGQQVMLDFELAAIYGYTTKRFNEQVKNNVNKFAEDFRFQLTNEEWEILRSEKSTSSWGGRRYLPYAFTEQGIYMLMTVLRGELATQQSIALIRLFKQMKDVLLESRALSDQQNMSRLAIQTGDNTKMISELKEGLTNTQATLSEFMAGFGKSSPFGEEYLIMDGMTLEADVAYSRIYSLARKSVFVIDNYIGVKTLLHLRHVREDVEVTVFSDNLGKGLARVEFDDFCNEYPDVSIVFRRTDGAFHDRFVIIDYGTQNEHVFVCGASSKDAGQRTTVIIKSTLPELYHPMLSKLLNKSELTLK
ncbi:MAG: ORF6N domain-containing protein [Atopobiaceae bacterium]|nr:ORF6N domain-containing protein [Atopobiaceae bacterium]